MSRCLTRFPIGWFRRTQNITPIGFFYKEVVNLLGGCLTCEELVGVTHRWWWDWPWTGVFTWRVSDFE